MIRTLLTQLITWIAVGVALQSTSVAVFAGDLNEPITFDGIGDTKLGVSVDDITPPKYSNLGMIGNSNITTKDLPVAKCGDISFFKTIGVKGKDQETESLEALVLGGGLIRLSVITGGWLGATTSAGIHVGSSRSDLLRAYRDFLLVGKVSFSSVNGTIDGTDAFLLQSADGQRVMVITTDAVKVVAIYVGELQAFDIDRKNHLVTILPCSLISG